MLSSRLWMQYTVYELPGPPTFSDLGKNSFFWPIICPAKLEEKPVLYWNAASLSTYLFIYLKQIACVPHGSSIVIR